MPERLLPPGRVRRPGARRAAEGGSSKLSALLPEILVEAVESLRTTRDSLRIVGGRHSNASDEPCDARRFLATEFCILQINIVDDLADRPEGGILEIAAREQRLERAAIAFV